MTIEEAVEKSGFKNPLGKSSRKYAQESLFGDEELFYAFECNYSIVPGNTPLNPGKVFSIKNKNPGIFAVTNRRIFVCTKIIGNSTFKELPIKQVQSMDEAASALLGTSQLRIKGITEIFIVDLGKKQKALIPEVKSKINAQLAGASEPTVVNVTSSSAADQLMKFKELLDAGLITKEEFDKEKAKLL